MVSVVLLFMLSHVFISLFCQWDEHLTSALGTEYWYLKADLSVEHARHNHPHNQLLGAESKKLIVALLVINLWIPKSLYCIRNIPSLVSFISYLNLQSALLFAVLR